MLKKFIVGCVVVAAFTHCVQPVKTVKIHPNCPEIPATTFEKVGLDAKAGALQFGKLVTVGEFSVKSDPQIISGISQSVRDDQLSDALVCTARERGELKTGEQIAHAWKVARFYRTNPTPADAMEFHKQNPFPVTPGKHMPSTFNEIQESEFPAIFTYQRPSLIPLGLACDIGYLPASEKVAYFYLEGIAKAHPEVITQETNRPGMDLYGDIALGLVFDGLFQTFAHAWHVKMEKKTDLPMIGGGISRAFEDSPDSDYISWGELSFLFPKSYALQSPVQTSVFFRGS